MRTARSCVVSLGLLASWAGAQSAINTDAALQPATGSTIVRQRFGFSVLNDPAGGSDDAMSYESSTTIVHGIYDRWTLIFNAPLRYRELDLPAGDREDFGAGDLTLLAKGRFYRDDFGINNTFRLAALGGLEIPSYDEPFSRESFNPKLGVVGTLAAGRHGLNADAIWTFDTGSRGDDRLRYDLAHTYRLLPGAFGEGVENSLYTVVELNGLYDSGGDHEIMLSPGVQYVMRRWTIEATIQVPVYQEVRDRFERELSVGLVFRVHF